jgi:hypothetical protein
VGWLREDGLLTDDQIVRKIVRLDRLRPWIVTAAFVACLAASDSYPLEGRTAADQANQSPETPASSLTCRFPSERQPAFLIGAPRVDASAVRYSGTIGNKAITMALWKSGSDLTGFYFYEQFRASIQLRGRTGSRGFTLTEFGDVLEPWRTTGAFEGSDDTSNDTLRGTWRAPNGARRVRFTLTRTPQKVDHQILITWERRAPGGYRPWQAAVDYSPITNQLIYLEQPDILSLFDLSTMTSRRLLKFDSAVRDYAQPEYPAGPPYIAHVVLSHAGDRVAFSAGTRGGLSFEDIYVMNLVDAVPRRLTDSLADFLKTRMFYLYSRPKFSPDDRTLLFQDLHSNVSPNTSLVVVSVAGGSTQTLGEGYSETAYWSADGTRVCTSGGAERKIAYEFPSGRASVGRDMSHYDEEKACRAIADAASRETCAAPTNSDFESDRLFHGPYEPTRRGGYHISQRWVAPDVVVNTYDLSGNPNPGYRIQVVRLLN